MNEQVSVDPGEIERCARLIEQDIARLREAGREVTPGSARTTAAFGDLDECRAAADEYARMAQATSDMLERLHGAGLRHSGRMSEMAEMYRRVEDNAIARAGQAGNPGHPAG